MKTLNLFKYFLLVVFAATLMVSCSDDDSDLGTQSDNIELRNGTDQIDPDQSWIDDGIDYECFVKVCVDVIPPVNDFNFNDLIVIDVPGIGIWKITDGEVTLPDGTQIPLVGNQYCFSVPINGAQGIEYSFHGYGGVNITGQWPDQTVCPLFDAQWPGTFKAPLNQDGKSKLNCDPPCPPPRPIPAPCSRRARTSCRPARRRCTPAAGMPSTWCSCPATRTSTIRASPPPCSAACSRPRDSASRSCRSPIGARPRRSASSGRRACSSPSARGTWIQ